MHIVPVPTTREYLDRLYPLWAPFIPQIARRSPWSIEELLAQLARGDVQPVLVFDGAFPVAMLGLTVVDDGKVSELVWMTGERREQWQHLIVVLEQYLREHVKVEKVRALCRPGWKRFLESHGYKQTGRTDDKHLKMEKVL